MQVEKLSNELLDSCDQFRESMGEVADNVSLAVALETLWSERIESSSTGKHSCWYLIRIPATYSRLLRGIQKSENDATVMSRPRYLQPSLYLMKATISSGPGRGSPERDAFFKGGQRHFVCLEQTLNEVFPMQAMML